MLRQTTLAIVLLSSAALIGACATGRPVEGHTITHAESFTGSASDGWGYGGSLTITSDQGVTCKGRLIEAKSAGTSVVVLSCDDGRAGSVVLVSGDGEDVGTGALGNDAITLSIGR
jgi:hypothetical protein